VKYLATGLLWLVFAVFAPFEVLIGVLLFLVSAPFDRDRRLMHAFVCRWTHLYIRFLPTWRVRVEGRERIPHGACVLVANHQSMADVLAVMALYRQFKFVSKASLFKLPLVGWMMRLSRYVALVRGKTRSTHKMMEDCRMWLHRGMPVLIFPEGTYSTGGKLLPFKRGAFQLAVEEKVPVVPVVLRGTTGLMEGDGPWVNPRCDIRVTVLPQVSPAPFGEDVEALSAAVRAQFEKELA